MIFLLVLVWNFFFINKFKTSAKMRCQAQNTVLSLVLLCLSSPLLAGLDGGNTGFTFARAVAVLRPQVIPGTPLLPGSDILAPNRELTPLEEVMLGNPELITPARAAGTIFQGFEDPNREEQENLF